MATSSGAGGVTMPGSTVSAFAGPVTRTWTVTHNAKDYTVQLYHNTVTGERSLAVDGAEVVGSAGTSTLFHPPAVIVFEVGSGDSLAKGHVHLQFNTTTVTYACEFAGVGVAEENSLINSSRADDAAARLKITVDAGDVGHDESGKPVIWFRVHTIREVDERETIVHRRFRDFFAVNEALRSAYTGSHLLSSFPSLPPRSFKLWEDHMSPEFVEKRKWQLQDYLFKLSGLPRMVYNPDFLTFLGLVDNVREVSILFPKDLPLGISLAAGTDMVEVVALKPLPNGSPSPAQLSGLVRVGDKVSKLNGEDVIGVAYDVIIAKIKSSPRPLMIHFLGMFTPLSRADDPDGKEAVTTLTMSPTPAPRAPPPPPADDSTVITDLIGGGVSFLGTGATPRPGTMAARTGLDHHASAIKAAAAEDSGTTLPTAFGAGDAMGGVV